jgi:NSS family neurotransmitter:Na+ symporter
MKSENGPAVGARPPQFTSLLSTVMTLAGVAIGLGNVWRFPYMMGSYGGSAFLLLYLVFMLIVAVPALTAELALARTHRGATITVLRKSFGWPGRIVGYALVGGIVMAASYYVLIVGNVFYSAYVSIAQGFSTGSLSDYASGLQSPVPAWLIAITVAWAAIFVIDRGLINGIERVSNIFVPIFFLICIYLIYATFSLPGAVDAVSKFLKPDFSRIGVREVFAALGQCYFSAGLGAAYVMVYGKFLRDDTRLQSAAAGTAFSDVGASLLASLFIVPTVLIFSMELSSGPGLLFGTMPKLFAVMEGGRVFGSMLLVGLCLVAFLSVIASFQVINVSLMEEPVGRHLGKRRLLVISGVLVSALIGLPAFQPDLIEPMDLVFGSGFTIFGGLLAIVAVVWRLDRQEVLRQFSWGATPTLSQNLLFMWLRFGIPTLLLAVLGAAIYDAATRAG